MLSGTRNFSVAEALAHSGGNIPALYQDNAQRVLEALQAIRDYISSVRGVDTPIAITSLYRSPSRNADTTGASSASQHLQAMAADFDVSGLTNHQATALILAGVAAGRIPKLHEVITYETDHHVHIGIAGNGWLADMKALVKTASGYAQLTEAKLAQLATQRPGLTTASVLFVLALIVLAFLLLSP